MSVTYWTESRKCKRPGCRRCPHGPYWVGRVDGDRVYYGTFDPRPTVARTSGVRPSKEEVRAAYRAIGIDDGQDREEAAYHYAIALRDVTGGVAERRRRRVLLRLAWETVCIGRGW